MNWSDALKAVIPVIVASLAWLLGQVADFSTRLTKIEGACQLEAQLIEAYNTFDNGYNLTKGGDGSVGRAGEKHPFFGKKRPDHANKMQGENHPMFGKKRPDVGARNAENIQAKHPFFGKKRPEHGAKVSAALKGRKKSPEHIAKMWASRRANALNNLDGLAISP